MELLGGLRAIPSLRIENDGTQVTVMGLPGENRMKSKKIATNRKRVTVSSDDIWMCPSPPERHGCLQDAVSPSQGSRFSALVFL